MQNAIEREKERLKRIHKFIEALYNCERIGNDELARYLDSVCVSSLHDENLTSVIDYLIRLTENNEMIRVMKYVKKEFLLKQIEVNEFSVLREEKIRILKEKLKKMEEEEEEDRKRLEERIRQAQKEYEEQQERERQRRQQEEEKAEGPRP